MKFSTSIKRAKEMARYYSEGLVSSVERILERAPYVDSRAFSGIGKDSFHVEIVGELFGEMGTWIYDLKFNEFNHVSSMVVKFVEDKSSKKPFADTYEVKINTILEDYKKVQNPYSVCELRLYRTNNYRFSAPFVPLSATDIYNISKPELISKKSVSVRGGSVVVVENSSKLASGVVDKQVNHYPLNLAHIETEKHIFVPAEVIA